MRRKILITAGSTNVPIDKVRLISNVFSGRTGTAIAKYYAELGDEVVLITSSPKLLADYHEAPIVVKAYKTFDQLKEVMEKTICENEFDVIIHSSAVSDYRVAGVFVHENGVMVELDASKKISSKHKELFLRQVPTEKLVDLIRSEWGFKGTLVKFKLEVGITDEELIEIAKRSREASDADYIVANCLEWMGAKAYIVDRNSHAQKVYRKNLPAEMYRQII